MQCFFVISLATLLFVYLALGEAAECVNNSECSLDTYCHEGECLLIACTDKCGPNTECYVSVDNEAVCSCKLGYAGNPCDMSKGCQPDVKSSEGVGNKTYEMIAGKKSFYFVPESMNWVAANKYCSRNSSSLATIKSQTENEMVLTILPKPGGEQHVWLGGICPVKGEPCFWVNPWSRISGFHYFHPEEPNQNQDKEACLTFNTYFGNWSWGDGQCPSNLPFVCETYL